MTVPAPREFGPLLAHLRTYSTAAPIPEDIADGIMAEIAAGTWTELQEDRLVTALHKAYGRDGPGKKKVHKAITKLRPQPAAAELSPLAPVDPATVRRPVTIPEAAWMFRDYYKGRALYATNGQWWLYRDAGVWERASDPEVDGAIKRTLREARCYPDTTDVKNPVTFIKSAREWAASDLATGDDPMGLMCMPKPLLNVTNGTLEMDKETGEWRLREHRPEDHLVHMLPVAYDPAATCSRFDAMLSRIFGDDHETRDCCLELLAYILQPLRFTKVFAIFHGVSNSGKSAPMQILSALLGPAASNRPMAGFGASADRVPRDAIASLVGKHLIFDDDFPRAAHLPDGFLKQVSEWKQFTGKHLYKDEFQFISRAVAVICANHAPTTSDPTGAFSDRARVFAMNRGIRSSDANFGAKAAIIREELPGVLVKLLAVFPALWRRQDIPESPAMFAAKQDWLRKASVLRAFTDSMQSSGARQHVDGKGLYEFFRRYVREYSPGTTPMALERFLGDVRELLPPKVEGCAETWAVNPPHNWRPGEYTFS